MKQKQEEICECGHEKENHSFRDWNFKECENCSCKKFTPKNHSPQGKSSKKGFNHNPGGTQNQEIPERAIKGMLSAMEDVKKGDYITLEKGTPQNQEKGCGIDFIDDEENERMCGKSNNYGQMFYCKECQEKEK